MNIFVTDRDPEQSARNLCDKHVPKMVLESAQMMSNAYYVNGWATTAPYRQLMIKHPCSIWALKSKANYEWLGIHAIEICREYTKRFNKVHACQNVIESCLAKSDKMKWTSLNLTEHVQVMPLIYRHDDVIKAYRSYIKDGKQFAKWNKGTEAPSWMKSHKVEYNLAGTQDYMKRGIPLPVTLDGFLFGS